MKHLTQLLWILLITFMGEILHAVIPLPVPAGIYGLVLLLLALMTRVLRLPQVEETADFLVSAMPVMFVPAAVGVLSHWNAVRAMWLPILLAATVLTVMTMGISGSVTQWALKKEGRKK